MTSKSKTTVRNTLFLPHKSWSS